MDKEHIIYNFYDKDYTGMGIPVGAKPHHDYVHRVTMRQWSDIEKLFLDPTAYMRIETGRPEAVGPIVAIFVHPVSAGKAFVIDYSELASVVDVFVDRSMIMSAPSRSSIEATVKAVSGALPAADRVIETQFPAGKPAAWMTHFMTSDKAAHPIHLIEAAVCRYDDFKVALLTDANGFERELKVIGPGTVTKGTAYLPPSSAMITVIPMDGPNQSGCAGGTSANLTFKKYAAGP